MGKTPEHILEKNRRWRERNREKLRAANKAYYAANAEKCRASSMDRKAADPERKAKDRAHYLEHKRARRRAILEHLGGKCARCGFSDWRGLQIDHIGNGGCQHRKGFSNLWTYYKHILDHIGSGEYQVLCANCNQIKRYEEGTE